MLARSNYKKLGAARKFKQTIVNVVLHGIEAFLAVR